MLDIQKRRQFRPECPSAMNNRPRQTKDHTAMYEEEIPERMNVTAVML